MSAASVGIARKPYILGIEGLARAGKNTLGDFIAMHYGFKTESFALPIKRALCAMLGYPMHEWVKLPREIPLPIVGKSPRYLEQTLGTEWGRDTVNTTIWTDQLKKRIRESTSNLIVVTDVRFENEADFIRGNGNLIHISRASTEDVTRAHISENGVICKAQDHTIYNDIDLTHLYHSALEVCKNLDLTLLSKIK